MLIRPPLTTGGIVGRQYRAVNLFFHYKNQRFIVNVKQKISEIKGLRVYFKLLIFLA